MHANTHSHEYAELKQLLTQQGLFDAQPVYYICKVLQVLSFFGLALGILIMTDLFWVQMLNSLLVGVGTALIVVGIAALASFAITRLRIRFGWLLSNAALLTYVIPASFLAIPFYKIMDGYGLLDNLWSLILIEVTFATPYAIFIFQQYSTSIPRSLEESAKIDGATTPQIFFHIFLPLMMPALVAVGTYALLLAWNEYLYAFLLLSTPTKVTVPVALGFFLSSDESPWNLLMAAAIIYSIPPLVIYYLFRGRMTTGLTIGSVKG